MSAEKKEVGTLTLADLTPAQIARMMSIFDDDQVTRAQEIIEKLFSEVIEPVIEEGEKSERSNVQELVDALLVTACSVLDIAGVSEPGKAELTLIEYLKKRAEDAITSAALATMSEALKRPLSVPQVTREEKAKTFGDAPHAATPVYELVTKGESSVLTLSQTAAIRWKDSGRAVISTTVAGDHPLEQMISVVNNDRNGELDEWMARELSGGAKA